MSKSVLWKVLFAAAVMSICLFTKGVNAYAAETENKEFVISGIVYLITSDADGDSKGTVTVKSYNGCVSQAAISKTVSNEGKTYKVTKLGDGAFAFADITELIIPDTVTAIGNSCFYGCADLKKLTIGKKVKQIGYGILSYCDSLESLSVKSANKYFTVSEGMLYNKGLTTLYSAGTVQNEVVLPETCVKIAPYAFEGNTRVKSLTAKGLKKICDNAFYDAKALEKIEISSSVKTIVGNPFKYCHSLINISVDPENEVYMSVDNYLLSKSGKTLYCGMAASEEAEIPYMVKYIRECAFMGNTKISALIINPNVKKIYDSAFYGCSGLRYVRFNSRKNIFVIEDENLTYPVFGNTFYNLEVSLPYSSKAWKEGSIEETLSRNCPEGTIFSNK